MCFLVMALLSFRKLVVVSKWCVSTVLILRMCTLFFFLSLIVLFFFPSLFKKNRVVQAACVVLTIKRSRRRLLNVLGLFPVKCNIKCVELLQPSHPSNFVIVISSSFLSKGQILPCHFYAVCPLNSKEAHIQFWRWMFQSKGSKCFCAGPAYCLDGYGVCFPAWPEEGKFYLLHLFFYKIHSQWYMLWINLKSGRSESLVCHKLY